MTILLNNTGNPITREERIKINENWDRIVAGLANLQFQISTLTGGQEISDILDNINKAIADVNTAQMKADEAIRLANEASTLAQSSASNADLKAQEAMQSTLEAQQATAQLNIALDNVNTAIADLTKLKQESTTATTNTNEATRLAKEATQNAITATNAINAILPNVTGLENRKAWSNSVNYKKNNFVYYQGNTYMALKDNVAVAPPSTEIGSNDAWSLVAKKGDKGDAGAGLSIKGSLTDISQLPPTGEVGDAYTIDGNLWTWSEATQTWENVGYIKGEKGDSGQSAYEVAVANGYVGSMEDWLKSLQATIKIYNYVITPEFNGQTDITIPLDTFAQDDDLLLSVNGTVVYNEEDFTVAGNIITLKEPIADASKTKCFLKITKNVKQLVDVPTYDGGLITDGTVTEQKLSKDLIDSFKLAITKDEFVSTEGQNVFNLTGKYVPNRNLLRVVVGGVEQFSTSNFTETSTNSFTLVKPLKAGVDVVAIYYSTVAPLTTDLENRVTITENKIVTIQSDLATANQNLKNHESKIASATELGHVKVDNDTITIDEQGVIKGVKVNDTIYNATSTDGKLYVIDTTETFSFKNGEKIIVMPNSTSGYNTGAVSLKFSNSETTYSVLTNNIANLTNAMFRNGVPYELVYTESGNRFTVTTNIVSLSDSFSTGTVVAPTARLVNQLNIDKADKAVEAYKEITLALGTKDSTNPLAYFKDNFGIVHISGYANASSGTIAFQMPSGYLPAKATVVPVYRATGTAGVVGLILQVNGYFLVSAGSGNDSYAFNLSYRASN